MFQFFKNCSLIILLTSTLIGHAQQASDTKKNNKKPIKLLRADKLKAAKARFNNAQRLLDNVRLRQEDVVMDCDSAHLFKGENRVQVFGNVYIKKADSVDIYADYGEFIGNERLMKLRDNVRIIQKDGAVLTSNIVDFDMNKNLASYTGGGTTISDKDTVISDQGFFYTKKDSLVLHGNIEIYGEEHQIFSDYISYDRKRKFIDFETPTNIYYQKNHLYSELGNYRMDDKYATLLKNNKMRHEMRKVWGDTIFADGLDSTVLVLSNVVVNDTAQELMVKSDYCFFDNKKMESITTKNVRGINYANREDSLFFTADTLHTLYDSTKTHNNIFAFHHIRMYKSNMQAHADSLHYSFQDSTIYLTNRPIVWVENHQIKAEEIRLYLVGQEIDSADLSNKAFIFTKKNEFDYNQIRGKDIYLKFMQGNLRYADIKQNAQSIYYMQQQRTGKVVGLNRAKGEDMFATFQNGKIYKLNISNNATSDIDPIDLVKAAEAKIEGFEWHGDLRPQDKFFTIGGKQK